MAKSVTQEAAWLHTWTGLVMGWLLFPIFLTGSLCVFWHEIDAWARPESHAIHMPERRILIRDSLAFLQAEAPDARLWQIQLPLADLRDPVLELTWTDAVGEIHHRKTIPDIVERPLETRTHGGRVFVDFHWALRPSTNAQPEKLFFGFLLVGAAGVAFLVAAISGVIIHKRIFKDFFVFRPGAKTGQRRWLDAHNVLGVLPFPFHVMIVVTGLAFFSFLYAPSSVRVLYDGQSGNGHSGSIRKDSGLDRYTITKGVIPGTRAQTVPVPILVERAEVAFGKDSTNVVFVRDPGRANEAVEVVRRFDDGITFSERWRMAFDGLTGEVVRTLTTIPPMRKMWDIFSTLHFAFFGGALMRWLYLVCGMAGAATIATGLVLFTVKRAEKKGAAATGFFALVARINVVSIAGSCVACAAYMWGVRLLPATMAHRMDWEVNIFLLSWAACAIHGLSRRPQNGWTEQLALAAALCLTLPLLGFVVPNSALPAMIAAGDWKTAGVDLTAFALGLILSYTAYAVSGRKLAPVLNARRLSVA